MGREASYQRLTPTEFDYLMQHPETTQDFFGEEALARMERSGRVLRIRETWDGLHYLLTSQSSSFDSTAIQLPLRNIVVGGTETPYTSTYGTVRYLVPDEVRAAAELLRNLDEEELRAHFRCDLPQTSEMDSFNGARDVLDELMNTFVMVREFFTQATQAGDIILLSNS